jgi:hypothetical protein
MTNAHDMLVGGTCRHTIGVQAYYPLSFHHTSDSKENTLVLTQQKSKIDSFADVAANTTHLRCFVCIWNVLRTLRWTFENVDLPQFNLCNVVFFHVLQFVLP